MSGIGLLILGVVCLVIAYYAPLPPPVRTILNILGWIFVVVGLILIVATLLGLSLGLGALR